jgi:hypothetical protein
MVCTRCKEDKPETDFFKRAAVKSGLQSHCKLCVNAWRNKEYKENTELRTKLKSAANRSYAKQRGVLLAEYGGKCACCGESEPKFLSVDHIGGGGSAHRQKIGTGGKALACFLRRNGYPKDGFRLLCFNCNCAIGFFGECPHQTAGQPRTACAT